MALRLHLPPLGLDLHRGAVSGGSLRPKAAALEVSAHVRLQSQRCRRAGLLLGLLALPRLQELVVPTPLQVTAHQSLRGHHRSRTRELAGITARKTTNCNFLS